MLCYADVPKGKDENFDYRCDLLARAEKDVGLQEEIRAACARDILFYFNALVWTFDPRLITSNVPFITYPFQDEAILLMQEAIDTGRWFLLQKSRDMGASWMCDGVFDYQGQFRKGRKFLMMSRNADLVDKPDDADSLFWKIDFIHQNLPKWFLNTNEKSPACDLVRTKMRAAYKRTGSQLTGATTTKASGVGGRATAVFVDEFSRFDPQVARMIKAGIADVANCVIWNFTPSPEMGKAHPSYELVEQFNEDIIKGVTMHWRLHPEKAKGLHRIDRTTRKVEIIDKTYPFPPDYVYQLDGVFEWHSPWFDAERRKRGNDRDVKEMLEIDYDGSGYGVFDESMIREYILNYCKPPMLEGDLDYDPYTGVPKKFVKKEGGRIKLWSEVDGQGNLPRTKRGAGADISLGVRATPSCLAVARVDTGVKEVQVTVADMDAKEFAVYVVAICRWLSSEGSEVQLCWERSGPGETFGEKIIDLGYTSVWYPKDEQKFSSKPNPTPGWYPTNTNRLTLLVQYQSALSERNFINHSYESMVQCLEWTHTAKGPKHKKTLNKSDDPSQAQVNHGDEVIADGLCNMMMEARGGGAAKEKKKANEPKDAYDMVMLMVDKEPDDDDRYADWELRR